MKDNDKLFSESKVRNWCFQLFQALAYMHQHGYFHRDLKPGKYMYRYFYTGLHVFEDNDILVLKFCGLLSLIELLFIGVLYRVFVSMFVMALDPVVNFILSRELTGSV
jgi:serine/threonine protein kinase